MGYALRVPGASFWTELPAEDGAHALRVCDGEKVSSALLIGDCVGLAWVDEASPYVEADGTARSPTWYTDRADFVARANTSAAVFECGVFDVTHTGSDGPYEDNDPVVPSDEDLPEPVVARETYVGETADPWTVYRDFFEDLRDGRDLDTAMLMVDESGSMYRTDLQPAYGEFTDYLQATYPSLRIVETGYTDERYLRWFFMQMTGPLRLCVGADPTRVFHLFRGEIGG